MCGVYALVKVDSDMWSHDSMILNFVEKLLVTDALHELHALHELQHTRDRTTRRTTVYSRHYL